MNFEPFPVSHPCNYAEENLCIHASLGQQTPRSAASGSKCVHIFEVLVTFLYQRSLSRVSLVWEIRALQRCWGPRPQGEQAGELVVEPITVPCKEPLSQEDSLHQALGGLCLLCNSASEPGHRALPFMAEECTGCLLVLCAQSPAPSHPLI